MLAPIWCLEWLGLGITRVACFHLVLFMLLINQGNSLFEHENLILEVWPWCMEYPVILWKCDVVPLLAGVCAGYNGSLWHTWPCSVYRRWVSSCSSMYSSLSLSCGWRYVATSAAMLSISWANVTCSSVLGAASLSKMGYLISGLWAVLRSVINQNNTVNQIVKHSIFHDVLMFYNSSDQLMAPSVVMPL